MEGTENPKLADPHSFSELPGNHPRSLHSTTCETTGLAHGLCSGWWWGFCSRTQDEASSEVVGVARGGNAGCDAAVFIYILFWGEDIVEKTAEISFLAHSKWRCLSNDLSKVNPKSYERWTYLG